MLYPGLIIRYTQDGTEPTTESEVYSAELPFKDNTKLKAFNAEGRSSTTQVVSDH